MAVRSVFCFPLKRWTGRRLHTLFRCWLPRSNATLIVIACVVHLGLAQEIRLSTRCRKQVQQSELFATRLFGHGQRCIVSASPLASNMTAKTSPFARTRSATPELTRRNVMSASLAFTNSRPFSTLCRRHGDRFGEVTAGITEQAMTTEPTHAVRSRCLLIRLSEMSIDQPLSVCATFNSALIAWTGVFSGICSGMILNMDSRDFFFAIQA